MRPRCFVGTSSITVGVVDLSVIGRSAVVGLISVASNPLPASFVTTAGPLRISSGGVAGAGDSDVVPGSEAQAPAVAAIPSQPCDIAVSNRVLAATVSSDGILAVADRAVAPVSNKSKTGGAIPNLDACKS